jgi:hypothetical protein
VQLVKRLQDAVVLDSEAALKEPLYQLQQHARSNCHVLCDFFTESNHVMPAIAAAGHILARHYDYRAPPGDLQYGAIPSECLSRRANMILPDGTFTSLLLFVDTFSTLWELARTAHACPATSGTSPTQAHSHHSSSQQWSEDHF